MTRIIVLLILHVSLLPNLWSQAQPVSTIIGSWTDLLNYRNTVGVAVSDSMVFCASRQALYTYSLSDFNIRKLSKANGLSDISDVSSTLQTRIAYHRQLDLLLIAYTNGNLDLLQNGKVYNIPDIKAALITGEKRINHIHFQGDLAYLSTTFGVVVVDLVKREIKDTYRIGPAGSPVPVLAVTTSTDSIYAASAAGLFHASLAPGINLLNFANWQADTGRGLPASPVREVITFQGDIYAAIDTVVYRLKPGGTWQTWYSPGNWQIIDLSASGPHLMTLEIIPGSGVFPDDARVGRLSSNKFDYPIGKDLLTIPRQVEESTNGDIWVADFAEGLIKFTPAGSAYLYPQGPASSAVYDMTIQDGVLWAAPGGVDDAFGYTFNRDGIFSYNSEGYWYTYNQFNNPPLSDYLDLIVAKSDPLTGRIWFGSYWGGLIRYENTQFTYYNKDNSSLQAPTGDPNRTTVSGIATDGDGNAWVANNLVSKPLSVFTPDGKSQAFSFPGGITQASDIVVDDFGQKWIVAARNSSVGMVVYDSGDDPLSTSDDQARLVTSVPGNGNLHTNEVTTLAVDADGELWIGTTEGITVIYTPGAAFTSGNIDANRILVEEDGEFNYLLESEYINCIAVDGANRKWIGTNNGAFLMSADGRTQVLFVNEANSPLLSNTVLDIEIDPTTGTVYFGTSRGMIAYRGSATQGPETGTGCRIYPNPVRETYSGPITIDGVINNANVKITDVGGMMVWETTAQGGRVIWDGNNYNGERARTGIYLVFISNPDGSSTDVCKLMLVN